MLRPQIRILVGCFAGYRLQAFCRLRSARERQFYGYERIGKVPQSFSGAIVC
jgi:hypothetical protein